MTFPDDLKRGDILLYYSADLTDRVIVWKEGDDTLPVGHVEVYAGNGKSWASRNGIGVNIYDFRPDGLQMVRRPVCAFDGGGKLDAFIQPLLGKMKYGWGDIADSILLDIKPIEGKGMDCSHFAADLMSAAFCYQFDLAFPANEITPRDFKLTIASYSVWQACQPPMAAATAANKPNPYTAVAS